MRTSFLEHIAILAIGLVTLKADAADLALFDINFDFAAAVAQDATITNIKTESDFALRLATGHTQPWPGVTLPAKKGRWDLSPYAYVALAVKNPGASTVSVCCRVDNPGADGTKNCITGSVTVRAGQTGSLRVPLKRASDNQLGGKLFGMRGYPVVPGGAGTIDPKAITQLLVFVSKPTEDHTFEIRNIRASGTYTPPTAWVTDADPFFPLHRQLRPVPTQRLAWQDEVVGRSRGQA